jgi:cellulose synthase/poly-beta-1,6-N-acetylglucosamine synthase-like glycosyltransferase
VRGTKWSLEITPIQDVFSAARLRLSEEKVESVSIIVPAWNEARVLRRTLEALLDIDYDKRQCEVIVVAGGHDNTYEIAKDLAPAMRMFSRYVVIPQLPHGKNAAIQDGIREANNDVIVLLDADTTVSAEWLKNMTGPIEDGSCDLTIANPTPMRKNWVSDYYMVIKTYLFDKITTYSGHSMAFRSRAVRERLEYFLEKDVKTGVDYLLAKRFLQEGRKVVFAKDAFVRTHVPSSFKYFVLCELRWLTALISIDGVSYSMLARNASVVAALILAIPFFKIPFGLATLFNIIYVTKRTHMFIIAGRQYETSIKSLFGFIILSYAYHIIGLICYMKYFLGFSKRNYLYQGQRY